MVESRLLSTYVFELSFNRTVVGPLPDRCRTVARRHLHDLSRFCVGVSGVAFGRCLTRYCSCGDAQWSGDTYMI